MLRTAEEAELRYLRATCFLRRRSIIDRRQEPAKSWQRVSHRKGIKIINITLMLHNNSVHVIAQKV